MEQVINLAERSYRLNTFDGLEEPSNTRDYIEYMKRNPDSSAAFEVLSSWLLSKSNKLPHIELEAELKRLREHDSAEEQAKYQMIKMLLECHVLESGQVLADAKLVHASLKKRVDEIQKIESLKWWKRWLSKSAIIFKILWDKKTREEILYAPAQVAGEVHAAQIELAEIEYKKTQVIEAANQAAIKISDEARQKIESADQYSAVTKRDALKEAESVRLKAAEDVANLMSNQKDLLDSLTLEIAKLEALKRGYLADHELAAQIETTLNKAKKLKNTYTRTFWATKTRHISDGYDSRDIEEDVRTTLAEAMLISSLCEDGDHAPVLDIDFPAELVPSTTKGHHHLYLHKRMPWKRYKKLLESLAEAGIIEKGFCDMSIKREKTMVLLPGIDRNEVTVDRETFKHLHTTGQTDKVGPGEQPSFGRGVDASHLRRAGSHSTTGG